MQVDLFLLRQGHQASFEELYDTYFSSLYNLFRIYMDDCDGACMEVNEVFHHLWKIRRRLTSSDDISALLTHLAFQRCRSLVDKRFIPISYSLLHCNRSELDSSLVLFNQLLERFDATTRRIFLMHRIEFLPVSAIAQSLSMPVSEVQSILVNASTRYEKWLGGHARNVDGFYRTLSC